jgi:hypothetical protein
VDIGRYSYSEMLPVFRDSEAEAQVVWYPARDDAPVLGCPSSILYREWDRDEVTEDGEVWGPTGRALAWNGEEEKPGASGGHRCGDDIDFEEGGLFEPELPPVEYRPDGLPVCCDPLMVGRGGAVAGGVATVDPGPYRRGSGGAVGGGLSRVVYYAPQIGSGGAVAGGVSLVEYRTVIVGTGGTVAGGVSLVEAGPFRRGSGGAVAGGVSEILAGPYRVGLGGAVAGGVSLAGYGVPVEGTGGAVAGGVSLAGYGVPVEGTGGAVAGGVSEVEWTPPVGPGNTCATALAATDGMEYAETIGAGQEQWYTLTTGPTQSFMFVTVSGSTDPAIVSQIRIGSCPNPTVFETGIGNGIIGENFGFNTQWWCRISSAVGGSYVVKLQNS